MPACVDILAPLLAAGDLHTARFAALEYAMRPAASAASPSPWQQPAGGTALAAFDKAAGDECGAAWRELLDEFLLSGEPALATVAAKHSALTLPPPPPPSASLISMEDYDACCSWLARGGDAPRRCGAASPGGSGCSLANGSTAATTFLCPFDDLAGLIWANSRLISLNQDGFLRPFDVATVLWPAGYLLGLWVAAEARPGGLLWRGGDGAESCQVLDLGCGTGAVALAAAASLGGGAVVTATDRESRSLALATANAARNGLEVRLSPLDYATDEAVAAFAARHGVTAPSPRSGFVEVARVAGLGFGLHTRWSESESDFEVVVARRSVTDAG
ncbi:hypothetical protein EMIHUDRAFT_207103 [Emiliania huxleyi CCMP1516]|uniref:Methyltransferase small domain-containing protein n=2 Tax=Emiliania huxleyi TaxID=2903 RepID=A0A0D3JKK6_EMIH1|nr:hypothetical protein EMIHUDRAFT_207103 [Emiliania huxleyi CCMP1516]EOD24041.1 hypothetical protein EMIHUDRAFT_207103 [Emiliania huxleyi CCMP1516]|eukprot:XP_005776470.1 hypothetical protein EMIHUDRAFT_207103 [Emiliania huxleyi CCMP1516]